MLDSLNLQGLRQRTMTALVLAGIFALTVWLDLISVLIVVLSWSAAAEVLVMGDAASRPNLDAEESPIPQLSRQRYVRLSVLSLPLVLPIILMVFQGTPVQPLAFVASATWFLLVSMLVLLLGTYYWPNHAGVNQVIVGWLLVSGAGIAAASALHAYPAELLAIVIVIMVTDVVAMLGGRFGSIVFPHKLCPQLSPNKTWIGAIIGLAVGCGTALVLLPREFFAPAALAILVGMATDLLFSHHKRIARVKDSGAWIAGHGGTLDRCDSLIGGVCAYVLCRAVVAGF